MRCKSALDVAPVLTKGLVNAYAVSSGRLVTTAIQRHPERYVLQEKIASARRDITGPAATRRTVRISAVVTGCARGPKVSATACTVSPARTARCKRHALQTKRQAKRAVESVPANLTTQGNCNIISASVQSQRPVLLVSTTFALSITVSMKSAECA